MLILLLAAVAGLVAIRVAWWVVARLLPAVARLVTGMAQGVAAAAIVGGVAALIAAALGGEPFSIWALTTVTATPFLVAARVRDGRARPVRTTPPETVAAPEPQSAEAQLWRRVRAVVTRRDPRLDLAEAQVRRFREHAARHPLDAEVIDYAPLVERRLAEAVDLAEEAVALARSRAEQDTARRHLVEALAAIGAGADDRLGPARAAASDRLTALLAHVTARARRTY